MKFAAIDIGSNAIRLLISNVYHVNRVAMFKKVSLVRLPIRLGEEVFAEGKISDQNIERLIKAMVAFKNLIDIYEVASFKACATSAMRDALNREAVIKRVKKEAGIEIEVIDGKFEAELIFSNHVTDYLDPKNAYLYIDVGGGSTELTLTVKNKRIASQSFNLGTIRLLQNKVSEEDWEDVRKWIKAYTKGFKPLVAIGTGGNINKLNRLAKDKENDKPLSLKKLKEIDALLNSFSLKDRIEILELNPDRADVITQASRIYITVMKNAGISKVIVPQLGLSDGVIHMLYEEHIAQQSVAV